MCGIGGIFGQARALEDNRALVLRMMDILAHRGPDGVGVHAIDGATLGNRRLAIIDVEHGQQPMLSEDGRYTLVFNGEIYNYVELGEKLTAQGVRLNTRSDTEVLLRLLMREGAGALPQLNGMFAFAFHDAATGQWLLARDPLGIKPLYYTAAGAELVFASEIKALLAHPAVQGRMSLPGLQQYLTFQFCLGSLTLFQDIVRLEPGCYLQGSGASVSHQVRYWDADYHIAEQHSESEVTERLLALLEDSTRLQLRSDVPLGAYLSGGLDSTVVASFTARHLRQPLHVFHGRFAEGPAYDESSYARQAAAEMGAQLREIVPTAEQFVDLLPRLIYYMDEPAAGPGLFPQFMVSRLAAEHVKVVLGGQGGDEIFGGYARYLIGYLEQTLKGAIFETQEEGQHVVTMSSIIPNLSLLREYRPLMQEFWKEGLFEDMDARYFRLIDRSPHLDGLLTADARATYRRDEVFADFQAIFNHPETRSYFNKMTHFDLKTLLPALLQVEDRVSMAVSLESRVPLLDMRIVDFLANGGQDAKAPRSQPLVTAEPLDRRTLPTLGEIIARRSADHEFFTRQSMQRVRWRGEVPRRGEVWPSDTRHFADGPATRVKTKPAMA